MACIAAAVCCCGCKNPEDDASSKPRSPQSEVSIRFDVIKLDEPHLPNAWRLGDKLISGGHPEGDEAFASLARLGVKTVISVDGARPDQALAEKYGMTYVHLPHGYSGILDSRQRELAKAVAELPGPIYLHCHHGKHRSPAASATVCVGLGWMTPDDGVQFLKQAGTSPDYPGLYRTVAEAKPIDRSELSKLEVRFEPFYPLPPLSDTMVEIDQVFTRLLRIARNGWQAPAGTTATPLQEALALGEHYTELARLHEEIGWEADFGSLLQSGRERVGELEAALRSGSPDGDAASGPVFDGIVQRIDQNCRQCHRRFPDPPLVVK